VNDTITTPLPKQAPLLRLSNLSKSFGPVEVLRGVNLQIGPAEAVGLIGDNGAGKSTLVKILSGVYQPTGGHISYAGQTLSLSSPLDARRRGIEIIYQDLALCNHLSVAANIFLGREPRVRIGPFKVLDRKGMDAAAADALAQLGAPIDPARLAGTLSGGQRQLVAVARGLQFKPKLFLLDEPTAALANEKIRALLSLIERLKQRGVSVLLISHRFSDIARVCDRVVVLSRGQVTGELRPGDRTVDQTVAQMEGLMTGEDVTR
jgi:simple sugar transport system ATP-binding protein